jgi:hypothetical protein
VTESLVGEGANEDAKVEDKQDWGAGNDAGECDTEYRY